MVLEYESDHPIPQVGSGLPIEAANLGAVELETTVVRSIEQTDDMEQGAFSDSRRPDDGQHFSLFNLDVEVGEDFDSGLTGTETLAHSLERHHPLSVTHI